MTKAHITLETRVKQADTPIAAPMDEGVMMFSQETAHYYSLQEVAKDIWDRIAEPIRVDDLCAELLRDYEDVSEAECHKQVIEFLTEMLADDLIQIVPWQPYVPPDA